MNRTIDDGRKHPRGDQRRRSRHKTITKPKRPEISAATIADGEGMLWWVSHGRLQLDEFRHQGVGILNWEFYSSRKMMTGETMLAALAGIGLWTLAEYLLHRFLGHDRRTWPNAFAQEHTRHHSEGNYFAPMWKKALATIAVLPIVTAFASLALGWTLGLVFGLSFVAMYVLYETVHRRAHTHRGIGAYGRYLRRHHFHHHFANPRMNHGVTSPIWDLVFGTWQVPTRIRVPEKLCMNWLVDPDTGDVFPELASHYELLRRAA